jgi:hypothetical protein
VTAPVAPSSSTTTVPKRDVVWLRLEAFVWGAVVGSQIVLWLIDRGITAYVRNEAERIVAEFEADATAAGARAYSPRPLPHGFVVGQGRWCVLCGRPDHDEIHADHHA